MLLPDASFDFAISIENLAAISDASLSAAQLIVYNGGQFITFGLSEHRHGGDSHKEVNGYGLSALPNWYRIRDDGTNCHYEYSLNGGRDWQLFFSYGRTTHITSNAIGWGGALGTTGVAGGTQVIRLRSWRVV